MLVHKAPRTIRKARTMAVDLATGAYPSFVYGGALRGVPVFTTHGVTPDLLEKSRQFGLNTFVWTVNEVAEMEKFLLLGVDGIMSDFPEKFWKVKHRKR